MIEVPVHLIDEIIEYNNAINKANKIQNNIQGYLKKLESLGYKATPNRIDNRYRIKVVEGMIIIKKGEKHLSVKDHELAYDYGNKGVYCYKVSQYSTSGSFGYIYLPIEGDRYVQVHYDTR